MLTTSHTHTLSHRARSQAHISHLIICCCRAVLQSRFALVKSYTTSSPSLLSIASYEHTSSLISLSLPLLLISCSSSSSLCTRCLPACVGERERERDSLSAAPLVPAPSASVFTLSRGGRQLAGWTYLTSVCRSSRAFASRVSSRANDSPLVSLSRCHHQDRLFAETSVDLSLSIHKRW